MSSIVRNAFFLAFVLVSACGEPMILAQAPTDKGPGPAPSAKADGDREDAKTEDGPELLTLAGRGVQVYRCDSARASPGWVLDHPEADLLNEKRKVVGHHDAGPSWHLDDGSSVKGEVLEKTSSPEPRSIPWLRLRASAHEGAGALTEVETIRRTETHGGIAPVQGCDRGMVGAEVRVPYTATYTFYGKP